MIAAIIPCAGLRRHDEDWISAIRTLLAIPHGVHEKPFVNKTYSALVWMHPDKARRSKGKWTPICIPVALFPEAAEDSVCVA